MLGTVLSLEGALLQPWVTVRWRLPLPRSVGFPVKQDPSSPTQSEWLRDGCLYLHPFSVTKLYRDKSLAVICHVCGSAGSLPAIRRRSESVAILWSMAQCWFFGRWSIQRSCWTGQLGVEKWRVVVNCLFVCLERQRGKFNCTYEGRTEEIYQGWRNFLRALPKLSISFEEILPRAHRNFEAQNKALECSMNYY